MNNTYYRLSYFGGEEGKDYRVDYYDTLENAKKRIETDKWNDFITIQKVTFAIDSETGKLIKKVDETLPIRKDN